MTDTALYPRYAERRLIEALTDSPVTLIHGPRQCGKTTLAQFVGRRLGYSYFSFDDDVTRVAAESDPAGFVTDLPERVILDDVQRVPTLFTALKGAVDRRREPGRFMLTGSSNVLLLPKLADSLAGRMAILHLRPLAQCELERDDYWKPSFQMDSAPGRPNDWQADLLNESLLVDIRLLSPVRQEGGGSHGIETISRRWSSAMSET
jgi:predicted AAA+ superfamily ATPase